MASANQNLGRRLALGQLKYQKQAFGRRVARVSGWWRMWAMDLAAVKKLVSGEGGREVRRLRRRDVVHRRWPRTGHKAGDRSQACGAVPRGRVASGVRPW